MSRIVEVWQRVRGGHERDRYEWHHALFPAHPPSLPPVGYLGAVLQFLVCKHLGLRISELGNQL